MGHIQEKFIVVDFSYYCLLSTIFTKARCIFNPINIKKKEKNSSLIIKKLNQTQNTFAGT